MTTRAEQRIAAAAVSVLDAWQKAVPRRRWWAYTTESGVGRCYLEQYSASKWQPYLTGPYVGTFRGAFRGKSVAAAREAAADACLTADPGLAKLAGLE